MHGCSLAQASRQRQRPDLADIFACPAAKRVGYARAAAAAIEQLRAATAPAPQISDAVEQWLSARAVRGSQRAMAVETTHAFTEGEWLLTRTIANGLEWSYGWRAAAAQRLRFLLDFGYAAGLRISELANVALRSIEVDAAGDH